VTNTLDDGSAGSLRWAVYQANAVPGDITIDFDPTVFATPQTITLTGTQLELTHTTGTETITGPAVGVTVSGNNASRVFGIQAVSASMSGLTISGGHVTGPIDVGGGGILTGGTLTLTNCTVSGNTATRDDGGGIYNEGRLTLTNCTVSGNSAGSGGGLCCLLRGATTTLTGCTVSGNSATYEGGGLYSFAGTTTLTNCSVSGNSAGSGSGPYLGGGGLYCESSTTTLTNCSVSGNSAAFGGGLWTSDALTTLNNCTLSGNSAALFGGGGMRTLSSTTTLNNCTVSGNCVTGGAGGLSLTFSTATLTNTIVAANTAGGNPSDIDGYPEGVNASSSYNLIGPGGSGGLIDGINHNQVGVANPGLGSLGDHGGPTQTIDLLGGSPALNAGDPAQLGLADQRGVVRSGGVNIGAFRASASAFVVSAPDIVQSGVPFDVTVTAVDPFRQVAVGYTGTVTFGTTDSGPGVVLPADYAFVSDDGGMHTFTDTGLGETTLITPGDQTLTVMDTADNTITGSTTVTVDGTVPGTGSHGLVQAPQPGRLPGSLPQASEPPQRQVAAVDWWLASVNKRDVGFILAQLIHHAHAEADWWALDPW
jgi:parallel beta-helix repeat protein